MQNALIISCTMLPDNEQTMVNMAGSELAEAIRHLSTKIVDSTHDFDEM